MILRIKLVLLLLLLMQCARKSQVEKKGMILLSAVQFKESLQSEKDAILLDVRTPAEWKKGYIKSATHLDIFRDDFEQQLAQLDTLKTYFVYCASGGRSAEAVELMNNKGFRLVYDLDGGISEWKKAGLPIETN
jgi:phage shock protein E